MEPWSLLIPSLSYAETLVITVSAYIRKSITNITIHIDLIKVAIHIITFYILLSTFVCVT